MKQKKQILIIVHGWNGSKKSWQEFINLASNSYKIYFITLPCFDSSPCPEKVWGIKEYSHFLKQKIQIIKNKDKPDRKVILVAHSFGGQIASYLISQNKNLVNKLVLVAPAIIRSNNSFKSILLKPLVWLNKKLKHIKNIQIIIRKFRNVIYRLLGGHDYLEASGVKKEIFKKITKEDGLKYLDKIKMPTLLLWGSKDNYTPKKHSLKIKALISDSKLYVKRDGKHGLHITNPQWVLNKIKQWQ